MNDFIDIRFISFNSDILIALFRAESIDHFSPGEFSIRCSTRDEPRYTDGRMENQEAALNEMSEFYYCQLTFERHCQIKRFHLIVNFFGSEGFPNYVIGAPS